LAARAKIRTVERGEDHRSDIVIRCKLQRTIIMDLLPKKLQRYASKIS
jgi:hypothetical protein